MLDRIKNQRVAMILSEPFFGVLARKLLIVEDPTCKSTWTDGVSLGLNPPYVETLTDLQLRGELARSVMHPAHGHNWRRGGRDPDRWNRACHYAINPLVLGAGFQLPPGALVDGRFLGKSAEEIYAQLREEDCESQQQALPDAGSLGTGGAQAPAAPGTGPASEFEPEEVRDRPVDADGNVEGQWKVAMLQAAQAARMRGAMGGDREAMVQAASRPSVDWRAVLHRFVNEASKTDYTWSRPNSRYTHLGLYLPSLHTQAVGDAVFVRDTSGSVFGETQRQFAAEIEAVFHQLQPARLFVIDCDARINQVQVFERGDALDLGPVKGGGGTSFRAPFAWLEKEGVDPAFLVYLTDLDGAFPASRPAYPTLWASTIPLHKTKAPPFGETVDVIV